MMASTLVPFLPDDNRLDRGVELGDSLSTIQHNNATLSSLLTASELEWTQPQVELLTSYLKHRRRWYERADAGRTPSADLTAFDGNVFRLLWQACNAPTKSRLTASMVVDAVSVYGPSNANVLASMVSTALNNKPGLLTELHAMATGAIKLLNFDLPRVVAEAACDLGSDIPPAGEDELAARVDDALSFAADIVCSLSQLLALVPAAALSVACVDAPAPGSAGVAASSVELLLALSDFYERTLPALLAVVARANAELDAPGDSDDEEDGSGGAVSGQFGTSDLFTPRQRRLTVALSHGCLAAGHALLDSAYLSGLGVGRAQSQARAAAIAQLKGAVTPAAPGSARAAVQKPSGPSSGPAPLNAAWVDDPPAVCTRLVSCLSALSNHECEDRVLAACHGRSSGASVLRPARPPPPGCFLTDAARAFSLHSRVSRLRAPSSSGAGGGLSLDGEQLSYLASLVLADRGEGAGSAAHAPQTSSSSGGAPSGAPTDAQVAAVRDVLPFVDRAAAVRALTLARGSVDAAIERLLTSGEAAGGPGTTTTSSSSSAGGGGSRRTDRFDDGLRARTLALAGLQQEEEEERRLAEAEAQAASSAAAPAPAPTIAGLGSRAGKNDASASDRRRGGGAGARASKSVTLRGEDVDPEAAGSGTFVVARESDLYDDEWDDGVEGDFHPLRAADGGGWDSGSEEDGRPDDEEDGAHGRGGGRGGRGRGGRGGGGGGGPSRAPHHEPQAQQQQPQRKPGAGASGGPPRGGASAGRGHGASAGAGGGWHAPSRGTHATAGGAGAGAGPGPGAGAHAGDGGHGAPPHRGGGRGGRGGGGGGPVVGHGPRAQGGLSERQADRKEAHKARVGNHNRKRGADKKMRAAGML